MQHHLLMGTVLSEYLFDDGTPTLGLYRIRKYMYLFLDIEFPECPLKELTVEVTVEAIVGQTM